MEYHLHPPFFIIEPESSFDDAWESFCCELLNLENRTNSIRRRLPPDLGCDLIWEEKKIAYQCKIVESGQASKLNMSKIKHSIETAIAHKDVVGWDRYILCTNVNLTGKQEQRIRAILPTIEFHSLTFWRALCKKFPSASDARCRQLVPVPKYAVVHAIDAAYLESYAQRLQNHLDTKTTTLLVYSNRQKQIFKVPVSLKFTVDDVLNILIEVFKLPGPANKNDIGINVSLSYSLIIEDKVVPLTKKLTELSHLLDKQPLVTFWKTIIWEDQQGQFKENSMEFITIMRVTKNLPVGERSRIAIERYEQEINAGFNLAIAQFREKN